MSRYGTSLNLLLPFAEDRPEAVQASVDELAGDSSIAARGAVFTKSEVVEGILDLCGYRDSIDLTTIRLLEPSFGEGEFLFAAVRRLLRSCVAHHGAPRLHVERLTSCIVAVELHRETFRRTRERLQGYLNTMEFTEDESAALCDAWLVQDDYLLAELPGAFDVAVGNPPYVRQERIPAPLLAEYRRRYQTLYDRADLYVMFYERTLDALTPNGVLGFICANRWVKNKYGGPLRAKVASGFHLETYIDLAYADAFHEEVDAYPAVTILRAAAPGTTRVLTPARDAPLNMSEIVDAVSQERGSTIMMSVERVAHGSDPWLLDAPGVLALLRRLEESVPALEDAGAKVGIGVATGSDRIFIRKDADALVEPDRLLRLAMASDLEREGVSWSGHLLVNPWMDDGTLAPLDRFPRFGAFIRSHEAALRQRHTARKAPNAWYKTIDRVYPHLAAAPKLLIPDIKGGAMVVYDAGEFYPHHNLYTVVSDIWDLRALQAVLRSSLALAFVAAYCVRMAGGFLRFQAQYLRRIRVPHWKDVSKPVRARLIEVATCPDQNAIDDVVFALYNLDPTDANLLARYASDARVSPGTS